VRPPDYLLRCVSPAKAASRKLGKRSPRVDFQPPWSNYPDEQAEFYDGCSKPLLRRTLSLQMHEPLRQRIAVQYHLEGLSREELDAYLAHQLTHQQQSQIAARIHVEVQQQGKLFGIPQRSNRGDPAVHRAHRGGQALALGNGQVSQFGDFGAISLSAPVYRNAI
jgi:hypothetical protein